MVNQYAIKFHIMALVLAWDNEALVVVLYERLSSHIKEELMGPDLPSALDNLVILAT